MRGIKDLSIHTILGLVRWQAPSISVDELFVADEG